MTKQEVELVKRIQYLEYKLEIVYQGFKKLQNDVASTNLDEIKEA